MKNYQESDYAINKYNKGIVYRFANGVIEVTLADYLASNPTKTGKDFARLKKLSDTIYLNQVRLDNRQTYKNTCLCEFDETMAGCSPSPEEQLIDAIDEQERIEKREERVEKAKLILDKLTAVQRKRYLLSVVHGLTTRQIAEIDGVSHQSVVECLNAAEKKIKKILSKV